MLSRTLAAIALLCLSLTAACGEADQGHGGEPASLVDHEVAARPESPRTPTGAPSRPSANPTPIVTSSPSPSGVGETGTCSSGYVALTFDDGPSPITPRFLAYLTSQQVPATFFVVGSRMAYQPGLVQREQRLGFSIGNHTYSHADLERLSDAGIRQEIHGTSALFRRYGITPSGLVRPPYGAIDQRVDDVLVSMRLHPFQWTIDSEDWLSGDPSTIAGRVIGAIRPHRVNVVLMHDGLSGAVRGRVASEQTIGAVPIVVAWARAHGYCFTAPGRAGWPQILAHLPWPTPIDAAAGGRTKLAGHAGA